MKNSLFLKGILYLALVPILLTILIVLALSLSLLEVSNLFGIVLLSLIIYFSVLLQENAYSDSKVLDMVEIPNAPRKIEALLKKGTRKTYRLVNANLILILGAKKTLCQSDLAKYLNKRGFDFSIPGVTRYTSELEAEGIFASRKGAYRIEYHLTKKGEWCYEAVRKCFPKRFFFFVIRHYLRFQKLPKFPQNNENSKMRVIRT